jgi:large subunit ribosomal protein L15
MPVYRRLPKRGFNNLFKKVFAPLNLDRLQAAIDAGRLDASKTVDLAALRAAGLVGKRLDGVRLLARGELKAAITLEVDSASKAAAEAIEKAGGKLTLASTDAAVAEEKAPAKAPAKAKAPAAKAAAEEVPAAKDDAGEGDTDEAALEGTRPAGLDAPKGDADDLKKIGGVGPKLEETLNKIGIYHYWQIAEFTPDNVAWVDGYLSFKGRIDRDDWIGQAKALAADGGAASNDDA